MMSAGTANLIFLSTLPARGATFKILIISFIASYFYPRSPRGERPMATSFAGARSHFYPRSPRGERHESVVQYHQDNNISIHAPREGSDRPWTR